MSDLLAVFILDLVNDDALLANTTTQLEALKTSSEQFFQLISDLQNNLPPISLADVVETQNRSLQTLHDSLETLRANVDALRRTAELSLQRVVPHVENCMTTDNFSDSTPHHHNCPQSGVAGGTRAKYYRIIKDLVDSRPIPSTKAILMELHRLTSPENAHKNASGSAAKRKKLGTTCYSLSSDGSVHNSVSPGNAQLEVINAPFGAQIEGLDSPSSTHSLVNDSEETEIDVDSTSDIQVDAVSDAISVAVVAAARYSGDRPPSSVGDSPSIQIPRELSIGSSDGIRFASNMFCKFAYSVSAARSLHANIHLRSF